MAKIIYEEPSRGLLMRVDEGYPDAFVDLLRNTIWGTEGLRYRSHELEQELQRIPRFQMIRLLRGETLIAGFEGEYVIADKAYDADPFRETIKASGAEPVIPSRSNRKEPYD